MIPNLVTLSRLPLLGGIVLLLYQPGGAGRVIAAPLILLLILLDTLDGVLARALKQTSLLGSVLDIAADRTVELVLWIVFADLGWIPILIPLVVVTRGVFVDAVRAVVTSRGQKPFEMMRTPLGRFLVQSPWLRTPFGLMKAVAFFLLALTHGLATQAHPAQFPVYAAAQLAAWLALGLCLARGIPVLLEAPRALRP